MKWHFCASLCIQSMQREERQWESIHQQGISPKSPWQHTSAAPQKLLASAVSKHSLLCSYALPCYLTWLLHFRAKCLFHPYRSTWKVASFTEIWPKCSAERCQYEEMVSQHYKVLGCYDLSCYFKWVLSFRLSRNSNNSKKQDSRLKTQTKP